MSKEESHPGTIFTWLYYKVKDTDLGKWFGFDQEKHHYGQIWFESLCFSIMGVIVMSIIVIIVSRRYRQVPRGTIGFFEVCVEKLKGIVVSIMGDHGVKFLPFLGTLFIFIFAMNLFGLVPAFRSPTMSLSITLALGITTFIVVQLSGIKANGPVGYVKHFAGPVWYLAFLILPIELISECVKPMSLSFRLYGNISGKDTIIEQLITMGGFIPIQLPILFLAVLVSFLQAFIFTNLAAVYLSMMTAHHESEH